MLSSSTLHFGTFPLKTRVQRVIPVHNPTPRPLLVQLYLLPDDIDSILWQGCNTTNARLAVFDLEDDECENCHQVNSLRCSTDLEEIELVRNLTTQAAPGLPSDLSAQDKVTIHLRTARRDKASYRLDTLPKYKSAGRGEWVLPNPDVNPHMLGKGVQGFYLSPKARNPVLIEPGQTELIDAVYFEATAIGKYRGKVLVRTNASMYEVLDLSAEATYARVAFRRVLSYRQSSLKAKIRASGQDLSSLDFSILEDDIRDQMTATGGLPPTLKVTNYFEAENVGTTDLLISHVFLNRHHCSIMGLTIESCHRSYLLKPNATMQIAVSYEVSFMQRELQAELWLFTEDDGFYLPIKLTMYLDDFSKYAKLHQSDPESAAYILSECFTLLDFLISIGYLIVVFKEILCKPEVLRFRLASTRSYRVFKDNKYRINTQIQPPILHRKVVYEMEEPEVISPPPLIPTEDLPKSVSSKPKKVKKTKVSILKFAPEKCESPKNEMGESGTLIATNRLLITKKKAKTVASTESQVSEIETEKPGGRDPQLFESTTTTHSEDGDSEEAEYLDDYKVRQGLFSGFYSEGR